MTSSFLISCIWVICDMEVQVNLTVFGIAKLNGKQKVIDGKSHVLCVIWYDISLPSTNTTTQSLFLNKERPSKWLREAEASDTPKGVRPLGVHVGWVKLPDKGEFEICYDLTYAFVPSSGEDIMIGIGTPLRVTVAEIPTITARDTEELMTSLRRSFPRPAVRPMKR